MRTFTDFSWEYLKSFEYMPPAELASPLGTLSPTDLLNANTWLAFGVHADGFAKGLERHIGENSTYTYKAELIQLLGRIVNYLIEGQISETKTLNADDIEIIRNKIAEGLSACTAGVHNRIIEVVNSLSVPQSLPELLHLARESLVESVAANISSDVHARNTVINLAHNSGFGVRARNQQDTYSGVIRRDTTLKKLTGVFKLKFTPFTIPELIRQQLLSCISSYYRGALEEGHSYDVGDMKAIAAIFNKILEREEKRPWNYFVTKEDELGSELPYDIDWKKVRRLIFEKMRAEKYFPESLSLAPKSLIEYVAFKDVFPEKSALDSLLALITSDIEHKQILLAAEYDSTAFALMLDDTIKLINLGQYNIQTTVIFLFSYLIRKKPEEYIRKIIGIVLTIKNGAARENIIEKILLAESPGNGPANAIRFAAQKGHYQCIAELLKAATAIQDKTKQDKVIEEILLAGFPRGGPANAIRLAAQNGHYQCIAELLKAATAIQDKTKQDKVIEEILLAGAPDDAPANAIRIAAQNGHHHCIAELLRAATAIQDDTYRDNVIAQMLLAGVPGNSPADAILWSAQNGHHHCIAELIKAAAAIKKDNKRDDVIEQMFLAEHPTLGPAHAMRVAAKKGYHQCLVELLKGIKKITDVDKLTQIWVAIEISLKIASEKGHKQCVKVLCDAYLVHSMHIAQEIIRKANSDIYNELIADKVFPSTVQQPMTASYKSKKDRSRVRSEPYMPIEDNRLNRNVHFQLM